MKIWPPDSPADISSFTAYKYNSRTCRTTCVCSGSDTSLTESKTLSPRPTISYTPHMIKDILRGTPGYPEEEEVEEVHYLNNPLSFLLPNTSFLSPSTNLSDR